MTRRTRQFRETAVLVILVAALALTAFLLLRSNAPGGAERGPAPTTGLDAGAPSTAGRQVLPAPGRAPRPGQIPGSAIPDSSPRPVPGVGVAGAEPGDGGPAFNRDDVEGANRSVTVDLGRYVAGVGQEFSVEFRISGPALTRFKLPVTFDPELLAVVAGSVEAGPEVLPAGLESHVQATAGLMLLASRGVPGAKSANSSSGQLLARFSMRALARGQAQLEVVEDLAGFVNARGDAVDIAVHDGAITIE